MILSTHTSKLPERFGYKETIKMIAEAGFDAYDMSFFTSSASAPNPFFSDDYVEFAKSIRAYADEIGIKCNQAHAPFSSSFGDAEKDEKRFNEIVRSMECAAILGASAIVVHPCQHLKYDIEGNPGILRSINIEFYSRLIPYCEKFGIKVACENMWQWSDRYGRIMHSTCSRAEEFVDYIDSIGSEWVVACLDIGHTALVDEKNERMINLLGKNRLKALHVHDVDGHSDLHTLPFLSKIDWNSTMKALGNIRYEGDFTFEVSGFFNVLPKELVPGALRFMYETGRYLISLIN